MMLPFTLPARIFATTACATKNAARTLISKIVS